MTNHKGQSAIDAIAAALGPIIMVSIYLQAVWSITNGADRIAKEEEVVEKLVSISDNLLRFNAEKTGEISRTNIADIKQGYSEWAGEKYGMKKVSIGEMKGRGTCITRYALVGGKVSRIYFCGEEQ